MSRMLAVRPVEIDCDGPEVELPPLTRIDVRPFQQRLLALERDELISRSEVARRLGWFRQAPGHRRETRGAKLVPDTGRVTRLLGLKATQPQRSMSYENAVRFCRALDLDPVDVGV